MKNQIIIKPLVAEREKKTENTLICAATVQLNCQCYPQVFGVKLPKHTLSSNRLKHIHNQR